MNSVFKYILLLASYFVVFSCIEAISIVDSPDIVTTKDVNETEITDYALQDVYEQDSEISDEDGFVDTSNLFDVEEVSDIININEDPDNCGSIGYRCSEHLKLPDMNAYPSSILCVAGSCVVDSCIEGRADCNNKFEDGCETYTGNDSDNCGYCGYRCVLNNAVSDCQFSTCSLVSCNKPYANCDTSIQNGCETDTSKDINNCGMCHRECKYNNAYSACIDSKCIFQGCREGFVNLNGDDKDGCEYQCSKSNNGVEICDGIDNNCDGFIDENCSCTTGSKMPCGFNAGRCRAGYYECINGKWDTNCKDAIMPAPEDCNGIDDDCNGETDEGLYRECQGGDAYLCNSPCGTGYEYCENGSWKRYNPPQPSKEVCNGKDDDCNGLIDDGVATCPSDMVPVGLCLCIDRFEASRPDATDTFTGTNNSYATSRPNVLPWTNVDWYTADKACKAAGKRLCTADEWRIACQGAGGYTYPYGNTYNPATCNGSDDPNPGNVFPTGRYTECKSPYGVFDMSGNVEEWNSTDYPDGKKGLRGGSYLNGTELYTKCAYEAPPVAADFSSRTIGFRCCKTP